MEENKTCDGEELGKMHFQEYQLVWSDLADPSSFCYFKLQSKTK